MIELIGRSEEETNKKRSKLEDITENFLGKDFETYSVKGFPYIFSVYSKKTKDTENKTEPLACIHVNKKLISLKNKDYLGYFTKLKEKYYQYTNKEWELDEDY